MALLVNVTAAALLALTIAYYVFVYTVWLKRRTPQNIVIGGASGAIPPMIGWAAATGEIGWGARRPVRHHLPVDAAAFLGAGPVPQGRLRSRRRADDAGRRRRAIDAARRSSPTPASSCRRRLLPVLIGTSGWLYGLCAAGLGARYAGTRAARLPRQGCPLGARSVLLLDSLSVPDLRGAAARSGLAIHWLALGS